jgi:hypothetical protein
LDEKINDKISRKDADAPKVSNVYTMNNLELSELTCTDNLLTELNIFKKKQLE